MTTLEHEQPSGKKPTTYAMTTASEKFATESFPSGVPLASGRPQGKLRRG